MSNLNLAVRRAVRSPANPLDKSTVVSIFPQTIREVKPTLQPGKFIVPAGTVENPSVLVVGTSSWWKDVDPEQPLIEIPTSSIQVADSIVKDYANGLLACDMGDRMPGLFHIPGEWDSEGIIKKHGSLLTLADRKQRAWFEALVRMADILWARSNGNPLAIPELSKLAAQELQFTEKPWLADFNTLKLDNCPACGSLRDARYPVCQHCHTVVDKEQYAAAGFTQVKSA